ncbi:uncharacterized protein LOC119028390 isoform X2 [Acanthopagrus latus]|uniref:uncharacterized protein LOC119028390 isoform X2 n=1 Tax=Acanthopagrus latus TaxID=8177 RepID=UPI00187D0A85|nr:uncharacterized protein LOC119028390 isoform X2 [Acanthopagrus latus]
MTVFDLRHRCNTLNVEESLMMVARFGLRSQIIIVILCCTWCSADISCRNEAGEPVDWFIIYKLPRYQIGQVGSGVDYMYLDSSVGSWQMSKFMVNTSQGAIGSTLNQLYKGKVYMSNSSVYALYNDGPPILDYKQEYGHTKGVLLFDRAQGFWLSHSIPHFPSFPERGYLYPSSGKVNGQTALCVTYHYSQFLSIDQTAWGDDKGQEWREVTCSKWPQRNRWRIFTRVSTTALYLLHSRPTYHSWLSYVRAPNQHWPQIRVRSSFSQSEETSFSVLSNPKALWMTSTQAGWLRLWMPTCWWRAGRHKVTSCPPTAPCPDMP